MPVIQPCTVLPAPAGLDRTQTTIRITTPQPMIFGTKDLPLRLGRPASFAAEASSALIERRVWGRCQGDLPGRGLPVGLVPATTGARLAGFTELLPTTASGADQSKWSAQSNGARCAQLYLGHTGHLAFGAAATRGLCSACPPTITSNVSFGSPPNVPP